MRIVWPYGLTLCLSLSACSHHATSPGNPNPPGPAGAKTYDVTAHLMSIDGAGGSVSSTSTPSGADLDCGTTCTVTRMSGTQLILTARPAAGFYFGGWSGDCNGFAATCTVSVTQARAITATFTPANPVFVTSEKHSVSEIKAASTLGGGVTEAQKMLSGADAICRRLGGSNDLSAWMASNEEDAAQRLPPRARGFVRHDGAPFLDQLGSGARAVYPVLFDETGQSAPPGSIDADTHFTGANADGSAESFFNCKDWTSTGAMDRALLGTRSSSASGSWWSAAAATAACDDTTRQALLCLGTKYTAVVSLPAAPPVDARLMFASKPVTSGGGVDALDAECQAEATAAHLSGTYRAFVALSTSSAAARFQARGVPLYRPDGAILAQADSTLLMGTPPGTTVDVMADGGFVNGHFFLTSATSPTTAATMNCTDYTNATQVVDASIGDLYSIHSWFSDGDYASCNDSNPIYCLAD